MALKIGRMKDKPGIYFQGSLQGDAAISRYNRGLAQVMTQSKDYALSMASAHDALPSPLLFTLSHQSMPEMTPPETGAWVLFQPWEFGSMPEAWFDPLKYAADQIWVHSEQNRQDYLREGIDAERVKVVPVGVDSDTFKPQGPVFTLPNPDKYHFIFSGDLLWQTGLDLLLKAYLDEFLPDEGVCLVIKDEAQPLTPGRESHLNLIQEYQANGDCAEIIYFSQEMSDTALASLYRACDCFVSPWRGDAFGLGLKEALACELQVLVTDAETFGLELPSSALLAAKPIKHLDTQIAGIPTLTYPSWHEINFDALRFQLREKLSSPEHKEDLTGCFQAVRSQHTWLDTYAILKQYIQDLDPLPYREKQSQHQSVILDGLKAYEKEDWSQAMNQFSDALEVEPENPILHLNLGSVYLEKSDYRQALMHFGAALKHDRSHANLFSVTGVCFFYLGYYDLAHDYFQRALFLEPSHTGAQESLSQVLEHLETETETAAKDTQYEHFKAYLNHQSQIQIQPTLALCMIVKNEEAFLRPCLESVKEIVDEMIIVDTGSTDATLEIAHEYAASVHHFEWNGSFSDARNAALAQAKADWVLILDADEVVSPDALFNIRELLMAPQTVLTGYQFKIRNYNQIDNDQDVIEHYMLRLFPNHPGLRYQGLIHEQLVPQVEGLAFQRLASPDVLLLHYGYTGEMMDQRDKYERNKALLEKALATEPDNPFHHFNLGLTYRIHNEDQVALTHFLKAVELAEELPSTPPYIYATHCYIASSYLNLRQIQTCLEMCRESPEGCHSSPDFWMNYGSAYNELGEYEQAIDMYHKAIALRQANLTTLVSDRSAMTWKPYVGIGNSYLLSQDYVQADKYFRLALKENPQAIDVRLGLVRLAILRCDIERAETHIGLFFDSDNLSVSAQSEGRFERARIYRLQGKLKDAETELKELIASDDVSETLKVQSKSELSQVLFKDQRQAEALELVEEMNLSPDVLEVLAKIHYRNGDLKQSLLAYQRIFEQVAEPRDEDYRNRGLIYLRQNALELAQVDFESALALSPADPDVHHNLGVIALQRDQLDVALSHYQAALDIDPKRFRSHLDLAKIEIHKEALSSAKRHLEQALGFNPKSMEVLNLLGFVSHRLEEFGAASAYYMDMIDLDENDPHAMIQLAYLLAETQYYSESLQLYERALALDDQNILVFNGIGMIFLEQQKYEAARESFLLAYQLEPDNPEVLKALQLADELVESSLPGHA